MDRTQTIQQLGSDPLDKPTSKKNRVLIANCELKSLRETIYEGMRR